MIVFLVGFMGSGKTTFGKRLASKVNYGFLDSDYFIETQENMTISAIFSEKGETHFRSLERKFLENLDVSNTIVSLGGGTPCTEYNLSICRQKGKMVYLQLDAKSIANRLLGAKEKRPLVEQYLNQPEALLNFISEKLSARERFYNQADITINALKINATQENDLIERLRAL